MFPGSELGFDASDVLELIQVAVKRSHAISEMCRAGSQPVR